MLHTPPKPKPKMMWQTIKCFSGNSQLLCQKNIATQSVDSMYLKNVIFYIMLLWKYQLLCRRNRGTVSIRNIFLVQCFKNDYLNLFAYDRMLKLYMLKKYFPQCSKDLMKILCQALDKKDNCNGTYIYIYISTRDKNGRKFGNLFRHCSRRPRMHRWKRVVCPTKGNAMVREIKTNVG